MISRAKGQSNAKQRTINIPKECWAAEYTEIERINAIDELLKNEKGIITKELNDCWHSDQERWRKKIIEREREDTAIDITKLIDDIEMKREKSTTEEWMLFKRIRNTIRDKYKLLTTL